MNPRHPFLLSVSTLPQTGKGRPPTTRKPALEFTWASLREQSRRQQRSLKIGHDAVAPNVNVRAAVAWVNSASRGDVRRTPSTLPDCAAPEPQCRPAHAPRPRDGGLRRHTKKRQALAMRACRCFSGAAYVCAARCVVDCAARCVVVCVVDTGPPPSSGLLTTPLLH
jgi:hypothetical protein